MNSDVILVYIGIVYISTTNCLDMSDYVRTMSGHHNMLVYCPQYTIHVHDPRFSLLPVQHQDSVFPRGYPCEPLPPVRTW